MRPRPAQLLVWSVALLGSVPILVTGLNIDKADGLMAALECEPKRQVLEGEGGAAEMLSFCRVLHKLTGELLHWSWPSSYEVAVDRAWSLVSIKCTAFYFKGDPGTYTAVVDCLAYVTYQLMRLFKWAKHHQAGAELLVSAKRALPAKFEGWRSIEETPYFLLWSDPQAHNPTLRPPPGGWWPLESQGVAHAMSQAAVRILEEFQSFQAVWSKQAVLGGPSHDSIGLSTVGIWGLADGFSQDAHRLLPSLCSALEGLLPSTRLPFLFSKQEAITLQRLEPGGYLLPRNGPERVTNMMCLTGCTGAWLQLGQDRHFFREAGEIIAFDGIIDHSAGNYGPGDNWVVSVVVSHPDFHLLHNETALVDVIPSKVSAVEPASPEASVAEVARGLLGGPHSKALLRLRALAQVFDCKRGQATLAQVSPEVLALGLGLQHNTQLENGAVAWYHLPDSLKYHFKFLRHFAEMPIGRSVRQARQGCQELKDLLEFDPSYELPGVEVLAGKSVEDLEMPTLLPVWVRPDGEIDEDAAVAATLAAIKWHMRQMEVKRIGLLRAASAAGGVAVVSWRESVAEQLALMIEHLIHLQLVNTFAIAVAKGIGEGMPQLAGLPPVMYHGGTLLDRVGHVLSVLGDRAQDPSLRFVEVGVYNGSFALGFLRNSRMQYLGVDPYSVEAGSFKAEDGGDEMFRTVAAAVREVGGPRAELRRARSLDMAAALGAEAVDHIFLDAGHYYQSVIEDLVEWWPVLRPGGIFFGHDFNQPGADIMVAVAVFCQEVGCSRMHLGLDSVFWLEK